MQRNNMKQARQKAGFTALQVNEQTGIDEMRLYSLERGRGRLHAAEAEALSRVLGVPVCELLGGNDDN